MNLHDAAMPEDNQKNKKRSADVLDQHVQTGIDNTSKKICRYDYDSYQRNSSPYQTNIVVHCVMTYVVDIFANFTLRRNKNGEMIDRTLFTLRFRFNPKYLQNLTQQYISNVIFLLCSERGTRINESIVKYMRKKLGVSFDSYHVSLQSITCQYNALYQLILAVDCTEQYNGKLAIPCITFCVPDLFIPLNSKNITKACRLSSMIESKDDKYIYPVQNVPMLNTFQKINKIVNKIYPKSNLAMIINTPDIDTR